ncbi:MAG: class D beta-lactamase [Cyanobacteria bacterium SBLK]|nr:class D beta-lactamase [Cyanobacteria bacterium SBLK]
MNPFVRFVLAIFPIAGGIFIAIAQPAGANLAILESRTPLSSPEYKQFNLKQNINFIDGFQDLNIEGSILIYDSNNQQTYQHNPDRNITAFSPASTFKILNSLIALESGAIANEISVLTWDGVERSFPIWNRDLNLREAFKISAVWFYQVLARRTGYETMKKWVMQANYGNKVIGTQQDIDKFWLGGALRITPQEQIQFLQRLYENNVPFSERTIEIVKDIMIVERTPNYTIRAKTGWDLQGKIGWYVGYLERDENVYFFAVNVDLQDSIDLPKRQELMRRSFAKLGLLD